ncbi:alpha/beta fold hydrolase [Frankia sp. CNm7]|uniref:Alpha/beta fold hydrolase n=1 Tax=Frankia nepalensis TaxID=1836974 RepID=A0A937RCX4_9ACTN|nr:alpha/beta fold hydrolase [Frankia nepalensis]MBL7501416.1 alpha/beta fold hydrolase [Frankia nepalensis]MBL7510021.1 alpha/beta fold hydrolase [Frankia nepalensis]MBL7517127.1 alpha/beta fold hydrolase [Frankia nepalensis]MBL7627967.1 alpha/beta fold hydrolase [Frankia nepalensis]
MKTVENPEAGRFRSEALRAKFLAAYDAAFAALWPTPWAEDDVETEFGTTHAHRFGPTDAGDGDAGGDPVVLLHGANSNAVQWYPFVAALGARHPVIALDTLGDPGRGVARVPIHEPATSAAWLDQVLAGLDIDRAHLVGHSYGGWLVLNQALHRPERLISVTALDPGGLEKVGLRFIWLMYLNGLAGLAPAPLRRRLAVWLDNPVLEVPELKKVLLTGARAFRTRRPAPLPLTDDDLRSIRTPTLALLGERSPLLHPRRAQARIELMPNGHADILPGVGHGPGFQRGTGVDVNARLLAFLDSTQPDPRA